MWQVWQARPFVLSFLSFHSRSPSLIRSAGFPAMSLVPAGRVMSLGSTFPAAPHGFFAAQGFLAAHGFVAWATWAPDWASEARTGPAMPNDRTAPAVMRARATVVMQFS